MPYDLYGQYYQSQREADNAEEMQCEQIDRRRSETKMKRMIADLEQTIYIQAREIQKLKEQTP